MINNTDTSIENARVKSSTKHPKQLRIDNFIKKVIDVLDDDSLTERIKNKKMSQYATTEKRYYGYTGHRKKDRGFDVREHNESLIAPSTFARYMSDYRVAIRSLNRLGVNARAEISRLKEVHKDVNFYDECESELAAKLSFDLLDTELPLLRDNIKFMLAYTPRHLKRLIKDLIKVRNAIEIKAFYAMKPMEGMVPFLNNEGAKTMMEKNAREVLVSHSLVHTLLSRLILSNHWADLALWVALASGRRSIEVLRCGEFVKSGVDRVLFSGQAKLKTGVADAYEIPLLVPADDFLKGVGCLRDKVNALNFLDKPFKKLTHYEVNSATAAKLNKVAKRHLRNDELTFKSARAIYAALIIKLEKCTGSKAMIYSAILGHGVGDISTGHHYAGIEITDDFDAPIQAFEVVFEVDGIVPVREGQKSLVELAAFDGRIEDTRHKALIKVHGFVKARLADDSDYVVSYASLGRAKARGGCGTERSVIEKYLLFVGLPCVKRQRTLAKPALKRQGLVAM